MLYFILFLIIGIAATTYGIKEQKTQYGEQHFAEAEVVGHQNVRSHNLSMVAMNAALGNVNPLVSIPLPDGTQKVVPLHTQISRIALNKFPELDVGGSVSVSYYGDNPKQAFLSGHPLAQTPLRCSNALLIGIVFLLISAVFLIMMIIMAFN